MQRHSSQPYNDDGSFKRYLSIMLDSWELGFDKFTIVAFSIIKISL